MKIFLTLLSGLIVFSTPFYSNAASEFKWEAQQYHVLSIDKLNIIGLRKTIADVEEMSRAGDRKSVLESIQEWDTEKWIVAQVMRHIMELHFDHDLSFCQIRILLKDSLEN